MELSPSWDTSCPSASPEIPNIVSKSKVHPRIHKRLHPVPLLNHINPVSAPPPPSHFLQINFYIILPSMPRCSKQTLLFRSPHQNPVYSWHVKHSCYMSCWSHSSWFYHPNNIRWGVQIWNFVKYFVMLRWGAASIFPNHQTWRPPL
jgi:hypothetical protein